MRIIFLIIGLYCYSVISAQNTTIVGVCKNNSKYKNIYLDDLSINKTILSDTILSDGSFKITTPINAVNLYKLRFSENAGLYLVLKPKDQIKIIIDINDLNNPIIEGSEDSKILFATIQELKNYDKKIELETIRLQQEKQSYFLSVLRKNSGSLAVLLFADQPTIDNNVPLMQQISSDLSKKYVNNVFVQDFTNKVKEASFLAIGTLAPEIEMPDTSGKIIKLSSLKGKYVVIDFWASWCGPCRATNPKLVSIYNKFKNKPFEIYAVSFDKQKESWMNAIHADKLPWIHVSDLLYWQSAAVDKYKVKSIPYSVLIDPNGNIVAKGLHPDELELKLNEIFR